MKRAQATTVYSNPVSQLLRSLLAGVSAEEAEALVRRIRQELYDPLLIERIPYLAKNHPFVLDAIAVSDAFEAVTNGMDNPEAFERLESVGKSSVVYPWKLFVRAVEAFYDGDIALMNEYFGSIPKDTPMARLAPVLREAAGASEAGSVPPAAARLIEEIGPDTSLLGSCIDQLEEALSNGVEDVFSETVALILKDMLRGNENLRLRFALWCLLSAADHEFSPSPLISKLKSFFPQAEVYRITSISMMASDPDIALLFWIRFLLSRLHARDLTLAETEAALSILKDVHEGAAGIYEEDTDGDSEYRENLESLARMLVQELESAFPGRYSKGHARLSSGPGELIEGLFLTGKVENSIEFSPVRQSDSTGNQEPAYSDSGELSPSETKGGRGKRKKSTVQNECPDQLELFA